MIPARALRLERYDAVSLDRQAFLNGEIFYDGSNNTLRLFDGRTAGGRSLATQNWTTTNFASLTAVTTNNATINSAIALKAPIASPTFTGTVTGTFSGNVTGAVTGNASTATKLAATKTINGVAFDGSTNISVSTLVNGANTVSLGSTGITTFPGVINAGNIKNLVVNDLGGGTSLTAGSQIQIGNSATAGLGVLIKNAVTNTLGGETSLEAGSKIQMDDGNVSLISYTYTGIGGDTGLEGRLGVEVDNSYLNNVVRIGTRVINTIGGNAATNVFQGVTFSQYGNISTPTGTVTASAVTTTNAITVGTNVNISTLPTQPQHASNKKYVDARSVAMSIALS
jgi:hypothetical protein